MLLLNIYIHIDIDIGYIYYMFIYYIYYIIAYCIILDYRDLFIDIRRPRRRQGGVRQRRHCNQPGARNDESKLQDPERGKQTKEARPSVAWGFPVARPRFWRLEGCKLEL